MHGIYFNFNDDSIMFLLFVWFVWIYGAPVQSMSYGAETGMMANRGCYKLLNPIRILHWLPVQTKISSSRVTVYGGTEALPSFRLNSYPSARYSVFDSFSCILRINYFQNRNYENWYSHYAHFLIVAYEPTTSFTTVKWRHPKNAIQL
jgi:hypothetical protein